MGAAEGSGNSTDQALPIVTLCLFIFTIAAVGCYYFRTSPEEPLPQTPSVFPKLEVAPREHRFEGEGTTRVTDEEEYPDLPAPADRLEAIWQSKKALPAFVGQCEKNVAAEKKAI